MVDCKKVIQKVNSLESKKPYDVQHHLKKCGYILERLKTNNDLVGQLFYDMDYGEVLQVSERIRQENAKNKNWKPKILPWAWFVVVSTSCPECD